MTPAYLAVITRYPCAFCARYYYFTAGNPPVGKLFFFFLLTRRHDIAFQACSQATAVTGHCYCGPTTITLIAWRRVCVCVRCTIRRTRSSEFVLGKYYFLFYSSLPAAFTARRFRKCLISSGARTRDWWRIIVVMTGIENNERHRVEKQSVNSRGSDGGDGLACGLSARLHENDETTTTLLDWNVR